MKIISKEFQSSQLYLNEFKILIRKILVLYCVAIITLVIEYITKILSNNKHKYILRKLLMCFILYTKKINICYKN